MSVIRCCIIYEVFVDESDTVINVDSAILFSVERCALSQAGIYTFDSAQVAINNTQLDFHYLSTIYSNLLL